MHILIKTVICWYIFRLKNGENREVNNKQRNTFRQTKLALVYSSKSSKLMKLLDILELRIAHPSPSVEKTRGSESSAGAVRSWMMKVRHDKHNSVWQRYGLITHGTTRRWVNNIVKNCVLSTECCKIKGKHQGIQRRNGKRAANVINL